jgi:ATP-binding cassette subfamily F protein 3
MIFTIHLHTISTLGMVNIRDLCNSQLKGIDEGILDYIVSLLEDNTEDDTTELKSTVAEFITSSSYASSDEEGMKIASDLLSKYNQLKIYFTKPEPRAKVLAAPVVLMPAAASIPVAITSDVPIVPPPKVDSATDYAAMARRFAAMAAAEEEAKTESSSSKKGGKKDRKDKSTKDSKGAAKEKESDKKPVSESREKRELKIRQRNVAKRELKKNATAFEKAQFIELELEDELEAAKINSTEARRLKGRYNGALEMSMFNLPNPGGGSPLLENASCTLVRGRKYGLIGRNGKGKSTMLKALAARRVGSIPSNVSVHYVSQDVQMSEETQGLTPIQCVLNADVERKLLLEEEEKLTAEKELTVADQKRLSEIIETLEIIGAETAERRAVELLDNLGFSEEMRARPLKALSGGWRVRTMLAAAIFAKPDLLLLDEPTNHLSILAVLWLARELSSENWNDNIIVIVSHDRYFMDEVCTDCLHISGVARRLSQHHGNYSTWALKRKEQQITLARESAKRKDEIEALKEYASHGFKYGGSSTQVTQMTKRAKQAEKLEEEALEEAEEFAALQEDVELPLNLDAGGEVDGFVIQLLNVSFGYPGCPELFQGADFGVTSKSRIVLLGENGNGKTTLVKLMLGALTPTVGDIRRANNIRFALVNQHHAEQIDLTMTPLEFMLSKYPGDGSYEHTQKIRSHLSSCGVLSGVGTADLQNVPASALSGGQRSRVALAMTSYSKPHVLFLDEPTNNLDLESVAALAESVKSFKGAVIVVSHDQYFVNEVSNEAFVVNKGAVKKVESFEAYRKSQLKKLSKM